MIGRERANRDGTGNRDQEQSEPESKGKERPREEGRIGQNE